MTTPLVIVGLLVVPFALLRLYSRGPGRGRPDERASGAISLALVLSFTGLGHFVATESMAAMLPSFVPARIALVQATGLLELALAAMLLVPRTRTLAGWLVLALLALFLPVNVSAALRRVPMGGHAWGPVYLVVRVPLQALLIAWTWWFVARAARANP